MNYEEEILDLEELSTINVSKDGAIKNQDARKMEVKPKENENYKRNGDLFLGNNGFELPNGVFVNQEELMEAIVRSVSSSKADKVEVIIRNKKIDATKMEAIRKAIKKCSGLVVEQTRSKNKVDARTVSVEQKDGSKSVQGGLFLGKDTTQLPNGDYRNVGEVKIVKQDRPTIPPTPTKATIVKKKKMPIWVKGVGLAVSASLLVPVVLQSIFMANSITWHHVPEFVQNILHGINIGLGELIADFTKTSGEWITNKGKILNDGAGSARMLEAYARYGLAALSSGALGMQVKQFVSTVKQEEIEKEQGMVK